MLLKNRDPFASMRSESVPRESNINRFEETRNIHNKMIQLKTSGIPTPTSKKPSTALPVSAPSIGD